MKRTDIARRRGGLALAPAPADGAGQEAARDRGEGPRQRLLRSDPPGLREVELRERRFRVRLLLHRPGVDLRRGRRGADRSGHARQARHRRHRDLAVERQADRPDHQDRHADDSGHDARRRPRHRGRRAAQDLSRHRQLPDGPARSASTSRRRSPRAARSARSRATPAPTTSCAVPRASATRCPARRASPLSPAKAAGPKSRAARCSPTTTAPRASRR